MPPKRDKRRAGPSANGGSNSGNTAAGRRMTRHNASSAAANSAASAAPSKRVATSKPEPSGRSTNNSRGKRRVAAASRTPTPTVKRVKRVPKGGKKEKELNSFKDENGEVYRIGDFAYVDSQQPDLPHHICIIRDFKLDRKDTVIAEVKWFYRVSELPESVYDLLMKDRQKGQDADVFKHPQMRERELFMAFNIDTHSASLFRGKCKVKLFKDVNKIDTYLTEENAFLYMFGYKPESRRLTLTDQDIYIPQSQQAELPECQLASPSSPSSSSSPVPLSPSLRYSRPETRIMNHEELVWKPEQLPDEQLLMFLRAARSIALHAGVCMKGLIADGYLAASADETTQHAFNTLHQNGHSTEKALQELVKRPTVGQLVSKRNWSKESTVLFAKGMRQFGKNFFKIQKELLPKKQIKELAEYYYYWKKTNAGLSSRNTRRQRKQTHIRLCRMMMKPREVTPEREFMDWSSCDEDDVEEDGEKGQSVYVCRQCYSTESPDWHHAGTQKAILCKSCRLYYKKYGTMKPVDVPKEAPEVLYKSHYESHSNDDSTMAGSRRKTRNSNGTRGVASRSGLRSQKIVKNESEEEEEVTDSSSEGSIEDEGMRPRPPPQPKQKALQTRRSMLDHLDDSAKATPTTGTESGEQAPPVKRVKKEEESDEDGSTGSTNGEGDRESTTSTQKSPTGSQKSPTNSSISSQAGGEKNESSSSSVIFQEAPPKAESSVSSANLPQNFSRASKDQESTCARTDLVYVHPPPEENPSSAPKLHPHVVERLTKPLAPPSHPPLPTSHPPSNIPIITNYAPQLPMGPGPILQFPFSYPTIGTPPTTSTPAHSVISSHDSSHQRHPDSIETMREAKRAHRDEEIAFHMQQKQFQLAQAQAAQVHASHAHGQLPTPHLIQGGVTQAPPISHATPHPMDPHAGQQQSQQQPVAFTFPSPEEVAHQQRIMAALVHSGGLQAKEPFAPTTAIFQPGLYPVGSLGTQLHPVTMEALSHLRPEEQAAILAAQQQAQGQLPPFVPPGLMEQLMVQQQQQAMANAVAAACAGPNIIPSTPENILEIQKHYEALVLAVQANPTIAQNPQVPLMIERYQRILQDAHARMHEAMLQNSQHHGGIFISRVPGGAPSDENASARSIRTGVIVHP